MITISIGEIIPVEFTSEHLKNVFYDLLLRGFPLSVLLTLFGISRNSSRVMIINRVIITIFASVLSFFFVIQIMWVVGFGSWRQRQILYTHKAHPEILIVTERLDLGALGYGGWRTVKISPFTPLFQIVQGVDTMQLDRAHWVKLK